MVESVYKILLVSFWSVMLFMGGYLIFGKVAESLGSTVYTRSRRLVGIAFVVFGVEYLLFSLFNLRLRVPMQAIAINLSVLWVVGLLLSKAAAQLLGIHSKVTRRWLFSEIFYFVIFLSTIWSVVLLRDDVWVAVGLVLGVIAFLCRVSYWVVRFFRAYRRINLVADNTYSECIEPTINWMPQSMLFIAILCYISGVATFAPVWCLLIYMVYATTAFCYIFSGLIGMMLNDRVVGYLNDVSISEDASDNSAVEFVESGEQMELRPYLVEYIERRLGEWIESEGYLQSDITIKGLASSLSTNRTYLSNYINSRYKCSFRDWVTVMRLERAKELFKINRNFSITYVAHKVGFTSPTSFSRAFARIEGVTPHRWREINLFNAV